MKELVAELGAIACDAGRLIARIRADGVEVMAKGDGSPVTIADARAEELILERLAKSYPEVQVVAEELSSTEGIPDGVSGRFFLVDPLDGTKEFIKGSPDYTVNIALIEAGVPVAGVVVAPGRNEIYSGYTGTARRGTVAERGAPVDERAIAVRPLPRSWSAVVSVSHMTPATEAFLKPLPIGETVSIGSSLKFCLIAAGAADIYPRFGRTMQWDTAAGDAVLRAAGGCTLTIDGNVLSYGPRPGELHNRFENPFFVAFSGARARLFDAIGERADA